MIAIFWRELKVSFSNIFGLIAQFVVPVFLLVLFATAISGNIQKIPFSGIEVNYVNFFAPGLFGYITFLLFAMSFSFIRIDRQTGMLSIIALTPSSLHGYYWGKFIMQALLAVLKVIFLGIIAYLITTDLPQFNLSRFSLFLLVIVLGVAVWYSLGLAGGVFIRRDDLREIIMMLVTLPLTFASSMYYNIEFAPGIIRAIAAINPLTYICNLLRGCYLGVMPENYITQLIILAAFAVAFMSVALYSLKKVRF